MAKIPDANWSVGWMKDSRFTQRCTEKLIKAARSMDLALQLAFNNKNLLVNAGPHRKAGPHGGGDARWHITVRIRGKTAWHIILNKNASAVVKIEKRSKVSAL